MSSRMTQLALLFFGGFAAAFLTASAILLAQAPADTGLRRVVVPPALSI